MKGVSSAAANNLIDEFAKSAKKPVVIRALEALEKDGSIQKKMFGKIKIYLSDQSDPLLPQHCKKKAHRLPAHLRVRVQCR